MSALCSSDINSRRSRREIKPTDRLRELLEAGEAIPGIPSALHSVNSEAYQGPNRFLSSNMVLSKAGASARRVSAPFAQKSAYEGVPFSSFGPDTFAIYDWQEPKPTDFLNLSARRKAWRKRVDQMEEGADIDDGDDWHDFSGNREIYPVHLRSGFALEYAVAHTFKMRAKRAFWKGKTWSEFAFEERNFDSEAIVKAEADPEKKSILSKEALDNKLRLRIFDVLKQRLCEEIWLEEYKDAPEPMQRGDPLRDSRANTPSMVCQRQQFLDPRSEQGRVAATEEEASRGIAYWSMDAFMTLQPVYADETGLPNGMSSFMADMREQKHTEAAAAYAAGLPRPGAEVVSKPLTPNMTTRRGGWAKRIAANSGPVLERPLDFSDSE